MQTKFKPNINNKQKGSLEFLPHKYKYDGSFIPEFNVTFFKFKYIKR